MKRNFILISIWVMLFPGIALAQSWQWAFTEGLSPRSFPAAVKQDHNGNLYTASYTDSISKTVSTILQKRNPDQQILWQKKFIGNVRISDVEIDAANEALVVGYFMGNVAFGDTILQSIFPLDNSGFILKTSESGIIQWVHIINPVNSDFQPVDVFMSPVGKIYLTSFVSGSFGFCAFHQLDSLGNILVNEFNNNFDNRTFTHILTDSAGNIYMSGTCGNQALFDTIHADSNFSYQNFLVKYNSNFEAQWLITREYITFDNNNSLSTDGHNLYWVFNDFVASADSIRIIKCDYNGNILKDLSGPLSNSFFPAISFEADKNGNSVLMVNVFSRVYLFCYDQDFNIVWTDTIQTNSGGFSLYNGLSCYDSSFYISTMYFGDSLKIGHFDLVNPNAGANYPSDIFTAKCGYQSPLSVNDNLEKEHSILLYPNPASDELKIETTILSASTKLNVFNSFGVLVYSGRINSLITSINTSQLPDGVYFIQLLNGIGKTIAQKKFMIIK